MDKGEEEEEEEDGRERGSYDPTRERRCRVASVSLSQAAAFRSWSVEDPLVGVERGHACVALSPCRVEKATWRRRGTAGAVCDGRETAAIERGTREGSRVVVCAGSGVGATRMVGVVGWGSATSTGIGVWRDGRYEGKNEGRGTAVSLLHTSVEPEVKGGGEERSSTVSHCITLPAAQYDYRYDPHTYKYDKWDGKRVLEGVAGSRTGHTHIGVHIRKEFGAVELDENFFCVRVKKRKKKRPSIKRVYMDSKRKVKETEAK